MNPTELQPKTQVSEPPVEAEPNVTELQPNSSSGGGAKKILMIVSLIVVLMILAGGLIYIRNQKQTSVSSIPSPVPTVSAYEDLRKDLSSDTSDILDTDMNEVDKDLQDL